MVNKVDLTMDGCWGSCGKGAITGWLALRGSYDTVVCAYGVQAGHTYNNAKLGIDGMMTQMLPIGILSSTVRNVLIGPGALINIDTILGELERYGHFMTGKRLMIHEHAAVVENYHAIYEKEDGRTTMGSTAKGVGEAAIERIRRKPDANVARNRFKGTPLEQYVVDRFTYAATLEEAEEVLVEGAQGFGLSMYHGAYPFVTSRDVSPWQILADIGAPFSWAPRVHVVMVFRTRPIRVSNRDGSSGPAYPGQRELAWSEVGVNPELTTVTKLPRRIFEFSADQVHHALQHCASADTSVALTFADYCTDYEELSAIIDAIETDSRATVRFVGAGPDDADLIDLSGMNARSGRIALVSRFGGV